MFERNTQALISPRRFLNRAFQYAFFSFSTITLSLFLGMAGYHYLAGISWTDSFYNASMILTGMGPALDINALPAEKQDCVKIFAGFYALYSGVVFFGCNWTDSFALAAPFFSQTAFGY